MDYKLAKELKDAGFPQRDMPQFDAEGYVHRTEEEIQNWIYEPDLSELIEACKCQQYLIKKRDDGSYSVAGRFENIEESGVHVDYGLTIKECFARLWLALKKK